MIKMHQENLHKMFMSTDDVIGEVNASCVTMHIILSLLLRIDDRIVNSLVVVDNRGSEIF